MTELAPAPNRLTAAELEVKLCADKLLKAAEELLAEIELRPGGYDFRPFYELRPRSQLNDPCAAVIRLIKAVEDAGGAVPKSLQR